MSKLEELIQQHCSDGVEYMPIGQISEIKRGERLTKSSLKADGVYSYDIDPHSYDVDPLEEGRVFKEQSLFACKQAAA